MALAKLAAVLAAVLAAIVAGAFAAVPTATAYAGAGYGAPESCDTQIVYFTNCLGLDGVTAAQCCGVVKNWRCFCQLEKEVVVPCSTHGHGRRRDCPVNGKVAKLVKVAELDLPCMKNLKC
ncbi:hypothetical protein ACP4OV_019236 [Aristida adscensionis]